MWKGESQYYCTVLWPGYAYIMTLIALHAKYKVDSAWIFGQKCDKTGHKNIEQINRLKYFCNIIAERWIFRL